MLLGQLPSYCVSFLLSAVRPIAFMLSATVMLIDNILIAVMRVLSYWVSLWWLSSCWVSWRRHDTQHDDIHHNGTQHNNIHNNNKKMRYSAYTLSIMTFSAKESVIMQSVVKLNVVAPSWRLKHNLFSFHWNLSSPSKFIPIISFISIALFCCFSLVHSLSPLTIDI